MFLKPPEIVSIQEEGKGSKRVPLHTTPSSETFFPRGRQSFPCVQLAINEADASRPITGKERQNSMTHLPRSALRRVSAYFGLSFPLGGMVLDAEDLAWGPCSITSATRAWTTGLPVQPCRSSVTLFARTPASQGSEEELNVLCNITSIRPMYVLITAICPGFGVRGQIPPEVFLSPVSSHL